MTTPKLITYRHQELRGKAHYVAAEADWRVILLDLHDSERDLAGMLGDRPARHDKDPART